jgi:glycosyltransferase involved in cell wall biosynthesis
MAEAVCELLTDENRRRGLVEAGRRAVEEAFSIHAVADRLEELYRDL